MTVSVKAFNELFQETQDSITQLDKEKYSLEHQIRKINNGLNSLKNKRKRLRELARRVVWYHNHGEKGYWEWTARQREGRSDYAKFAWKEMYDYKTADYHFYIVLQERTDLKKQKWEVLVHGQKEEDGYRENEYVTYKYKNHHLSTHIKFTSEEEARSYIEKWMTQLIEDHKEEIEKELALASTLSLEEAKKIADMRI